MCLELFPSMLLKGSLIAFAIIGIYFGLIGIVYLTTSEFMPYHSEAIQTEWSNLDDNFQGLFLGFLKGLGTGALIAGFTVISMVVLSFRESPLPYRFLLPSVSLGYLSLLLYAMYTVNTRTLGNPPIEATLAVFAASIVIAACFLFACRRRGT
jgi:peptidoglycan/LPS O-acetylase OafA/YrhL